MGSAAPRILVLLALTGVLASCDVATPIVTPPGGEPTPGTVTASPTESPIPAPSAGPSALPTSQAYVVQRGDTLTGIARRFGITVPQLLAANPQVRNPDTIRFGYPLTVPPRDSLAVVYRGAGGMIDPPGDAVDPEDRLVQVPRYADVERFTERIEGADLIVEIDGISAPPPLDPDGEELRYVVELDTTDDLEPDWEAVASNALVDASSPDGPAFGLSLLDRRTDVTVTGPTVPGSVTIEQKRLVIRLTLAGLAEPQRIAAVALVERRFYPDGRAVADTVEASIDRVPDQQWPRANPRWLVIARAP